MMGFVQSIEYDWSGMAARMVVCLFDNDPDFSCRWLCPHCLADSLLRRCHDDGTGFGGWCTKCGRRIDATIRDRSPYMLQGGAVVRPKDTGKTPVPPGERGSRE